MKKEREGERDSEGRIKRKRKKKWMKELQSFNWEEIALKWNLVTGDFCKWIAKPCLKAKGKKRNSRERERKRKIENNKKCTNNGSNENIVFMLKT